MVEATGGKRRKTPRRSRVQPDTTKPDYLIIAEIVGVFGLKGEVKANILTEFPERFKALKTVYVGPEHRPCAIESARFSRNQVILKLGGCDDPAAAGELRKALLFVPVEEAMPLPEDQFYHYQLVGLDVWTTGGEFVGKIVEVLAYTANDILVVQREGGEVLIPAIKDVVKVVDLENGRMEIEALPGLLEPNEEDTA
jgi:16S rRNA processing protein RimM